VSTIPAKEIERNRDEPWGEDHVCVFSAMHTCDGKEDLLLRLGSRHLRIKLCTRCPYTPQDLSGRCNPEAVLHLCANATANK
jgi:hypothetical protein